MADHEDDPFNPRQFLRPPAQESRESPYLYPGSNVLRNKIEIREDAELLRAEALFAGAREQELRAEPGRLSGSFNMARLKATHKHLFQDLYDWAGEARTVNIGKEGNWFTRKEDIEPKTQEIFAMLKAEKNLKGLDEQAFAGRAAHYYDQLNAAHPFREGNGRALRVFMHDLAREAGYKLDLTKIDRETHHKAVVTAFNGDRQPLAQLFEKIVVPVRTKAPEGAQRQEVTVGTRQQALRCRAEHYKGTER